MTVSFKIATALCIGFLFINLYVFGLLEKCSGNAKLYFIEDQIMQATEYTDRDLKLEGCKIVICHFKPCIDPPRFDPRPFDPVKLLSGVVSLRVKNVFRWPPLPNLPSLHTVIFDSVTPLGEFGSCTSLPKIILSNVTLKNSSSGYLSNCTKVEELRIGETSLITTYMILKDAPGVNELHLRNIEDIFLVEQYPLFSNRHHLLESISIAFYEIDFSVNTYTRINWTEVSCALAWQFSLLPKLKELNIEYFPVFDMCAPSMFPLGSATSYESADLECGGFCACLALGYKVHFRKNRFCAFKVTAHKPLWHLYTALNILYGLLVLWILRSVSNDISEEKIYLFFVIDTFQSLSYLELSRTNTTRVCYRNYHVTPQLQKLIIRNSPFIIIDFSELFSTPGPKLVVTTDNVRSIKFSRKEYLALALGPKQGQITLEGLKLSIDCSCDSEFLWLIRAIAQNLVLTADLRCSDNNKLLEKQTCDRLECNRSACKSRICVCCRIGPHDAIAAVCRDANLTALPDELLRLRNLTQLIVPNNQISSLPDNLPDTLLRLDLSGNKFQQLNVDEALVLFQVPTRTVRLAGNPLICNTDSCYNEPLLDALKFPKSQVEDSVECIGEAKILGKLPEVCELKLAKQREISLITAVVLIVILATMSLLALYYRQMIKIFLFTHGWCLCWLREDELDDDRRYDVFLSFCHADVQMVLDQLLPVLDQEFSVCVHLRDWMPGEMIPTQILRSVEQSRRTVVVVSHSYAKSLWGLLEFRTAYASGLSEGRIRVVMVVLDDVLESENLNQELKQYIQFNTYVRWGDPWFWSKLRYALPHKRRQTTRPEQDRRFEELSLF